MSMPATRHRFTLDDWHQMIETGVLWIVDTQGERVEVYLDPVEARYADVGLVVRGERLACPVFADVVLTVDEILG